jgi:hypothetical protein
VTPRVADYLRHLLAKRLGTVLYGFSKRKLSPEDREALVAEREIITEALESLEPRMPELAP